MTNTERYTVITENGKETRIVRNDGATIPIDKNNWDYRMFLKADTDKKLCKRVEANEKSDEQLWREIRAKRNKLVTDTDWMLLEDAPVTAAMKDMIKAYRQDLRDLPSKYKNPRDVVFPEFPHEESPKAAPKKRAKKGA